MHNAYYGLIGFDAFARSTMRRSGPPPTPTQVLLDRGSRRGKDRPSEVGYPKGAPPCPKFLSAPAKAEWRRVVKMLVESEVIQKTDLAALATYCRTWGEWSELTKASAGWDYTVENDRKQARMLADAEKRLQAFAAAFGFSPSARVRVAAVKDESEKEVDRVEQLFNKRRA